MGCVYSRCCGDRNLESTAPGPWGNHIRLYVSDDGGGEGSDVSLEQWREKGLASHNELRHQHGTPPLKLSNELNTLAQNWADHLAQSGRQEHSPKSRLNGAGENLAFHSNLISASEVTDMWYGEIKDYNFNKPGFSPTTGHFTQVVWKDSKELGLGRSYNQSMAGMYVYVANYSPGGNVQGHFEDNVLPKTK